MCEVAEQITRTPKLAKLVVEIREMQRKLLAALKPPEGGDHGETHAGTA